MKENYGILALLQDIKELLWGIALLLAGGFLCLTGVIISITIGNWGIVLFLLGIFVFIAGTLYARHGFSRHEVVEKQD